ncbi:CVNH domain-containing protein [Mycena rosella]|uniref:CVNH domain-containing protein n=1 Tax=Mycena rosella TaxID=1033263 RepID=A0AAD7DWQ4_MYCRO|nr:CVNH domain-containing protein [Mycena rosella]
MYSLATLLLLSSASAFGAAVLGTENSIAARIDGGFASTCRTITIYGGSNPGISAYCANSAGNYVQTNRLSLNGCIANDNGVMACQQNGGYGSSCNTLGFSSGTVLHATCKSDSGSNVDAHLELNNCIGNHNGQLACDF